MGVQKVTEKFSQKGKTVFNGQESVVSGQRIPDGFILFLWLDCFLILGTLAHFRHFRHFYREWGCLPGGSQTGGGKSESYFRISLISSSLNPNCLKILRTYGGENSLIPMSMGTTLFLPSR